MALQTTIKNAVRRVTEAFRKYADDQGWKPGDYRILIEVNPDWGRIHVIFVARQFPGRHIEDQWLSVINSLDESLSDEPELSDSINLTLRTFDEVKQGGLYALSPDYVDVDELMAN